MTSTRMAAAAAASWPQLRLRLGADWADTIGGAPNVGWAAGSVNVPPGSLVDEVGVALAIAASKSC